MDSAVLLYIYRLMLKTHLIVDRSKILYGDIHTQPRPDE